MATILEESNSTLIGKKEAAARLGVSTRQVEELCRKRRLPHFKIETAVRFDPKELENYLASCRRPVEQREDEKASNDVPSIHDIKPMSEVK